MDKWRHSKWQKKGRSEKGISRGKPGSLLGTRWTRNLILLVGTGAVMSYGAIAYMAGLLLNKHAALSMVYVLIPMVALMMLALRIVLKGIHRRIRALTDAIEDVSEGDLTVQLDLKDAQEYTSVYEQFNLMVKELAKTREEMQTFTNTFAHEFKTPITAINGFADYLLDTGRDGESEERLRYLRVIKDQASRLMHLSVDTLLLSKLEAMRSEERRVGKECRSRWSPY